MIEILNRCNDLFQTLTNCETIEERENCLNCVQTNFRTLDNDSYNCLKKLCTYTMYYGPMYVSEIYHFLTTSQLLETYFSIFERPINIMSLGCGFGPDDIALNKYKHSNGLAHMNFNYYGYDKEPLWNYITQTNALPITRDLLDGMNFESIDILFINKFFSTLKNIGLHNDFLDTFRDALSTLPIGSFIVFNDINHYNEGRDIFNLFAQRNSLRSLEKYFFNISANTYNDNYIVIPYSQNVCTLPIDLPLAPKQNPTQSVFFVYQKV
ncbi:hypothetical protein [Sulfurospirillum cavolei]|uniref:hypothetical protein n=1 Tax=Sulfurospirillum cavolei TaxID=366522 RepID=UPI003FA1EE3E